VTISNRGQSFLSVAYCSQITYRFFHSDEPDSSEFWTEEKFCRFENLRIFPPSQNSTKLRGVRSPVK
jgi:hypothetical protein